MTFSKSEQNMSSPDRERKKIAEASLFVKKQERWVAEAKRDFDKKGWFGLWLDAKGFFCSSDPSSVLKGMEKYRIFYEDVSKCVDMAELDKEGSYDQLISIQSKLEKMEQDAESDAEDNSRAVCKVVRYFLENCCKLNHDLKKVECIILSHDVRRLQALTAEMKKDFDLNDLRTKNEQFRTKNQQFRKENDELKQSVTDMKKENDELKQSVTDMKNENEELRKKIEELSKQTNESIRKLQEDMQEMLKEMKD